MRAQGFLSGGGHGHARWGGQRASRNGWRSRQSLVLAGTPLLARQRHACRPYRDKNATTRQALVAVRARQLAITSRQQSAGCSAVSRLPVLRCRA